MEYRLTDLIDTELLQSLTDRFSDLTGIATGIMDRNGVLIASAGWQTICTDFHCCCAAAKRNCQLNDMRTKLMVSQSSFATCKCPNGMTHYATAIEIDGNHLGTIITGQILPNDPDWQHFPQQACQYRCGGEISLRALGNAAAITPRQIEKTLLLVTDLTRLLAQIGLERKQRLQAEKEIAAREARLKLIVESSNDGFWTWDEDNSFVMSDRCAEIIEFYAEEYDPLSWLTRIHPEDVDLVISHFNDYLAGRLPYVSIEYRVKTGKGNWKWINLKARVTRYNASGFPSQLVGSISDISERKQFEADLLESESLYRSLVETSPSAIILTDCKGIIKFVNSQGAELSGWNDPAELVGQSGLVLLDKGQWKQIISDYMEIMTAGCCKQGEYTCVRQDGSSFIAELNIAPIYNAHQRLRGCICIAQDITDRKNMERELLKHRNDLEELVKQNIEALRLSEEKFAKAFTVSPIAMSIVTLEEGRYIEVNDAYCSLMGYTREEIIGQTSLMVWNHPEKRDEFKQLIKEQGLVKNHEFNFVTKSGEVRVGLLSGQHIQFGEETFILSSINDITEQRRIDREMARLDRMNLIGEMAASIGHEIRNPMTTVRGLLQIMSNNKLYARERELFELMIEELDRANFIITEFLSLAKDKHVELLPGNISKIVESVIPLIQANAMSQEISVVCQCNPVPDILLDNKEIRQLILNLTQNGLEAMQKGSTLTLRTYLDNGQVVLMVQDEGPGIDDDIMEKLGLPFVTTKEKGIGLGLSVCYRIAARHNATIDVQSTENGTTFLVRFPLSL